MLNITGKCPGDSMSSSSAGRGIFVITQLLEINVTFFGMFPYSFSSFSFSLV